jgi:hypothetical protein
MKSKSPFSIGVGRAGAWPLGAKNLVSIRYSVETFMRPCPLWLRGNPARSVDACESMVEFGFANAR